MPDASRPPATYDDVLAAPPHLVAEILYGELNTSPRPRPRHALVSSVLGAELGGSFHRGRFGPGGWWILDEPELHLGPHVVVPDVAGWRRERMPTLPETAWFETPPDWVAEVLSPATERFDRAEKADIYAAAGVRHMWLVDPDARTLEAYELTERGWLRLAGLAGAVQVAQPPFDAAPFPLGALWPDDGETPPPDRR